MAKQKLGDTLRDLRNHKGITQDVISNALNITRQTYGNYETGKRIPDLDMLCRIAAYYHITLDQLVITGIHPGTANIDPFATLPPEYQDVIRTYHELSYPKQQRLREYMNFLKQMEEPE